MTKIVAITEHYIVSADIWYQQKRYSEPTQRFVTLKTDKQPIQYKINHIMLLYMNVPM